MVDIAKAGWLMKESSFLKRWKKYWFALSMDGYLRYFESPDNLVAKKTISIPRDVIAIKTGTDVEAQAPDAKLNDHLIKLITREDGWVLCADDVDDMLAWQIALEQARVMPQPQQVQNRPNNPQIPAYLIDVLDNNPNNGYPTYYRGHYRGNYPSRIVHTPQGPITVIYIDDYRYPYRYSGGDMALGALTGAALASTFMWPFWFPLFWC